MSLVWLHLKLNEQVSVLLSRMWCSKIARLQAPAADMPFIFRSLHFVVDKKWNPTFFAYVVFAQILIKIMHVCIIHIYVYI
jgi:hypothetical protein